MASWRVVGSAAIVAGALACTKSAPPKAPAVHAAAAAHPVAFLEDDVDAAMKRAKTSGKVVFVDGWAQWCHTCLSMRRDVLGDPSLSAYEDRVVFAAVDTDKLEAAPFVAKYPLRAWPTLFVIDPVSGAVLAERGGSLSLPELRTFLDEALQTRDPAHAKEPQTKAILEGHAAMAQKDYAAAEKAYGEAVSLPGPRVPEAALGAMRAFTGAKDDHGCVDFGVAHAGTFRTSSSAADFVSYLAMCATDLPEKDAKRGPALAAARKAIEALTSEPPPGASVDDKADALAILADVAEAQKDHAAFVAAHEKRLALLEADAKAQKTVEAARVHDYARLNSYVALGRGDEAIAMLTERTKQLPDSYEAWARLASAYHQLHKDDDAVPAFEKAISLSYGPRRLLYRTQLADIYAAKKDKAGEKKAVADLVADAESLPPGQRDDDRIAKAKARLAALQKP